MDTRVLSPEAMSRHLAQPGRYGRSAESVLETCSLIAAADLTWESTEVSSFQEKEEIHEKVWVKLVTIAKDSKLKEIDPKILPSSYTALYGLVVMSQPEWDAAIKEGAINARASSRSIIDWTRKYRLGTPPDHQEKAMTILLTRPLEQDLWEAMKEELSSVCLKYDAKIFEGKKILPHKKIWDNRVMSDRCLQRLLVLLREIVKNTSEDLRESFGIYTGGELARSTKKIFPAFIIRYAAEQGEQLLNGEENTLLAYYPEHYILFLAYTLMNQVGGLRQMRDERHLRHLCRTRPELQTNEMRSVIEQYLPSFSNLG